MNNRKFEWILIAGLSATVACSVLAEESPNVVCENDFESCVPGKAPAGWDNGTVNAVTDQGNSSQVLFGSSKSRAGSAPSTARYNFPSTQGPIAVEFKMQTLREGHFSVYMTLYASAEPCFLISTAVGRLHVDTLMNGTRLMFMPSMHNDPVRWANIRIELDTGKEYENCTIFIDGKPATIMSVPGIYTVAFDGISFGWMAVIDNLKITSGQSVITQIETPEKYTVVNLMEIIKRDTCHKLPSNADPYQLFLGGDAPEILKVISETVQDGIKVRKLVFLSRPAEEQYGLPASEVYAIIARPVSKGPFPGILILHGGGGSGAEEEHKVIGWAQRGYVAMAIDVPGVCNPVKALHSNGVARTSYGANRWAANPDAATSPLFDAQLAGMQALNLLRIQPHVMMDRIGLTGISWGGFTATGVAGLAGDKLRAVFAVYGCGFLDQTGMNSYIEKLPAEEKKSWLNHIDAGRKCSGIKASYFIAAPTNDGHFWPPAVSATLNAISGEKNQLINPNENHRCNLIPGGTRKKDPTSWLAMEIPYFDYYLKGEGKPFPKVRVKKQTDKDGQYVFFTVEGPAKFDQPEVYYTMDTDEIWPKRTWRPAEVKDEGGNVYSALLPENISVDLYWFAMVSDARDITVSSQLQRINAVAQTKENWQHE